MNLAMISYANNKDYLDSIIQLEKPSEDLLMTSLSSYLKLQSPTFPKRSPWPDHKKYLDCRQSGPKHILTENNITNPDQNSIYDETNSSFNKIMLTSSLENGSETKENVHEPFLDPVATENQAPMESHTLDTLSMVKAFNRKNKFNLTLTKPSDGRHLNVSK